MLAPVGTGDKKAPQSYRSPADEFGRENVQAVRLLVKQASKALDLHQSDEAQAILHQANELWEAVPAQPGHTDPDPTKEKVV